MTSSSTHTTTPSRIRPMPQDLLPGDTSIAEQYREDPSLLKDYSAGWQLGESDAPADLKNNETVPDYINRMFADNPVRWEAALDGWEDATAGLDYGHQVFCTHHGSGCGFKYHTGS